MKILIRLLKAILLPFLALILLFEEWGWEPLAACMARLARLPLWAKLERWIAGLPRYGALLVFVAPSVLLIPAKLMALYFFSTGHAWLGALVLISAKLVGTAVLARLFHLTQPALMQFVWFAKYYPRWKAWKDALLVKIHTSMAWRTGHYLALKLRNGVRKLWRRG